MDKKLFENLTLLSEDYLRDQFKNVDEYMKFLAQGDDSNPPLDNYEEGKSRRITAFRQSLKEIWLRELGDLDTESLFYFIQSKEGKLLQRLLVQLDELVIEGINKVNS